MGTRKGGSAERGKNFYPGDGNRTSVRYPGETISIDDVKD